MKTREVTIQNIKFNLSTEPLVSESEHIIILDSDSTIGCQE